MRLSLNVPTVAILVALAATCRGMGAACATFALNAFGRPRSTAGLWLAQGVSLTIYTAAVTAEAAHFLSTAFGGVG